MSIWKRSERAVRDKGNVPVNLLYDEDNDATVMNRGTDRGTAETSEDNLYWKQTRMDYDGSDNMIYFGVHKVFDAAGTDAEYWITKYTYTGTEITRMQKTEGAWDSRTGLF